VFEFCGVKSSFVFMIRTFSRGFHFPLRKKLHFFTQLFC